MTAESPSPPTGAQHPYDLPDSVYREMGFALRAGLAVALGLLGVAGAYLIVRKPGSASDGWIRSNPLVQFLDPRSLAAGLAAGTPEAYLTLGVYALIATPVVRVITGMSVFFRHGERRMGYLTLVVLALLFVGLLVIGPLVR